MGIKNVLATLQKMRRLIIFMHLSKKSLNERWTGCNNIHTCGHGVSFSSKERGEV